jgi:uncharacterized tellurite resistance protein B-like protein
MLERFLAFLAKLPGGEPVAGRLAPDDPRVAAAALMVHVMEADGVRVPAEEEKLAQMLAETYGVKGEALDAIMEAGDEAEHDAVDLYTFTRVLKRHLDEKARAEFIGIMWEIVYADGVRDEVEDNVVWRVAELIGVDRRERIAMRQRVAEKSGATAEHVHDD